MRELKKLAAETLAKTGGQPLLLDIELFYKHKPTGFFVSTAYQGEFGTNYSSNDITGTLGVFF
jgi:hypothetical protein